MIGTVLKEEPKFNIFHIITAIISSVCTVHYRVRDTKDTTLAN